MEKKEFKYIQFPVDLLPDIFNNKKAAFEKMLLAGCCLFANRIDKKFDDINDPVQVARQLIYHYTGSQKLLTSELINFIARVNGEMVQGEFLAIDGRVRYFSNIDEFNCLNDDYLLAEELKAHHEILNAATTWHKIIQAYKFFGVDIRDIELQFRLIKELDIDNKPLCMLSLPVFWDYYKTQKTELQLAQFAAVCAIKSILGAKKCILTNKQHIAARMFGYRSIKQLPETLHPIHEKYLKRYYIDKLLELLEMNWNLHVVNVPGLHGIYVSFTMDHEKLELEAQTKMQKRKRIELKEKKRAAKEKVKQQLNKEQQLNNK